MDDVTWAPEKLGESWFSILWDWYLIGRLQCKKQKRCWYYCFPPAVQSMVAVSVHEGPLSKEQKLAQCSFGECQFFLKDILALNFKDFSIVRCACPRETGDFLSPTALFQFSDRQTPIRTVTCMLPAQQPSGEGRCWVVGGDLAPCLRSLTQRGGDGETGGDIPILRHIIP